MDAELQDAVTLYFYPRMNDAAAQVAQEEAQVLQSHPGARVLDRRDLPLQRNGATYTARLATFEFEEVFAGRLQRVSSQLLVAFRALGTFKARSTAPFAQAVQAQASFLRLLEGVAWDAPGEIGAQAGAETKHAAAPPEKYMRALVLPSVTLLRLRKAENEIPLLTN